MEGQRKAVGGGRVKERQWKVNARRWKVRRRTYAAIVLHTRACTGSPAAAKDPQSPMSHQNNQKRRRIPCTAHRGIVGARTAGKDLRLPAPGRPSECDLLENTAVFTRCRR